MLARRTADDSPLGVSLFRFVPPKLELRSLPLSFSSSTSSPCARDSLSSISDLSLAACCVCRLNLGFMILILSHLIQYQSTTRLLSLASSGR